MINFDEATHTYTTEDGKKLISVTQLMKKHGLAPDYGSVPDYILNTKAERGSLIHKEIEDYIKQGEIGFTTELTNFISYIKYNNIKVIHSELRVYNDICAGTIDLILEQNGEYIQADIKTTAALHKDSVTWQNSIYSNMYNALHKDTTAVVTKSQCFHFDKDGILNVIDIQLKPDEEVEKLFQYEREGEQYTQELNTVSGDLIQLYEIESLIAGIETQKKVAEARSNELKQKIMEAMKANTIKTFENDKIRLTLVDPVERTTIDSAKLKKELPEIAEKYSKKSITKESLRLTLKEAK